MKRCPCGVLIKSGKRCERCIAQAKAKAMVGFVESIDKSYESDGTPDQDASDEDTHRVDPSKGGG